MEPAHPSTIGAAIYLRQSAEVSGKRTSGGCHSQRKNQVCEKNTPLPQGGDRGRGRGRPAAAATSATAALRHGGGGTAPSLPPTRSVRGGPCPASGSASGAHPGSVLGASLMPLPALPAARPAGSSGRRAGRRRGAAELPSAPLQSPGPGEDRASRPAVPSASGPAAAKGGPGAERSGRQAHGAGAGPQGGAGSGVKGGAA